MTRTCATCGAPHSQLGRRCPSCAALPLSTAQAVALLGLLSASASTPAEAAPEIVEAPSRPAASIYGAPPAFDRKVPPPPATPLTLEQLEVQALLGGLTPEQVGQVEGELAAESNTSKQAQLSRVLITNALSAGNMSGWQQLVERHLATINPADPELAFRYSLHLSKQSPAPASEVIRWADVALEHRDAWNADVLAQRVPVLFRLRAEAARSLWVQAAEQHEPEQAAAARERTLALAEEWLSLARATGISTEAAQELCRFAGGSASACSDEDP